VSAGKRWCPRCKEWLGPTSFYAGRRNAYCRSCHAEWQRVNRSGMGAADRAELLALQGGGCAICGTKDPGGQGEWHLDHWHGHCPPGKSCSLCWRGLTCSSCNLGLGKFRDNPKLLMYAYLYLIDHRVRFAQMTMGASE
jgi:hypothetical protein